MRIIINKFGAHFSYLCRRNKRKVKAVILIFVVLPLLLYIYGLIRSNFLPIAFSVAESKAKSICTLMVNEAVLQQISSNKADYTELFSIQKNSGGEISAIVANTVRMNLLKSRLSIDIQNKIEKTQTQPIGIPLGSLFGNELIAGRGPKIPMKIVTVGAIDINFINSFTSAGINQTKHEASIAIKMTVSALMPAGSTVATIETSMPLTHTVIVGKIPEGYANIQL